MAGRIGCAAVVASVVVLFAAGHADAAQALQQPALAYVTRVLDGDTVYAEVGGRIEAVRYVGINTPVLQDPAGRRQPAGQAAAEANRRLVEGQWIWLVFDAQPRDQHGRLLAYVWVGRRFVNADLLHRGYAVATPAPPNVAYAEYFTGLERGAREAERGVWAGRAVPQASLPGTGGPGSHQARAIVRFKTAESEAGTGETFSASGAAVALPPAGTAASPGGDGQVNVRGYFRGDGTYVPPYTRSAPQR